MRLTKRERMSSALRGPRPFRATRSAALAVGVSAALVLTACASGPGGAGGDGVVDLATNQVIDPGSSRVVDIDMCQWMEIELHSVEPSFGGITPREVSRSTTFRVEGASLWAECAAEGLSQTSQLDDQYVLAQLRYEPAHEAEWTEGTGWEYKGIRLGYFGADDFVEADLGDGYWLRMVDSSRADPYLDRVNHNRYGAVPLIEAMLDAWVADRVPYHTDASPSRVVQFCEDSDLTPVIEGFGIDPATVSMRMSFDTSSYYQGELGSLGAWTTNFCVLDTHPVEIQVRANYHVDPESARVHLEDRLAASYDCPPTEVGSPTPAECTDWGGVTREIQSGNWLITVDASNTTSQDETNPAWDDETNRLALIDALAERALDAVLKLNVDVTRAVHDTRGDPEWLGYDVPSPIDWSCTVGSQSWVAETANATVVYCMDVPNWTATLEGVVDGQSFVTTAPAGERGGCFNLATELVLDGTAVHGVCNDGYSLRAYAAHSNVFREYIDRTWYGSSWAG